ncbi:MAG: histidine kinase [Bacteroidota bacterium]
MTHDTKFKKIAIPFRKISSHAVWWVIYILYELSIFYYSTGNISGIAKFMIFYTLNIILFYAHYKVLGQTLGGQQNKYLQLIFWAFAELTVFISIKLYFDFFYLYTERPQDDKWLKIKQLAALDLYRSLFFIGLSSLYWTASNISNYERKAKESAIKQLTAERDALALQTRLARSENALLRQQINPHLIFNSLNFIHSTVYRVSEKAAETVIMLTDILRFSMESAEEDGKIPLQKEIDQIDNLITLNRSRFKTTAPIDSIVTGSPAGHRIIPLVLTTLVENVFKHGDFIEHHVKIHLDLSAEGLLSFHTLNRVTAQAPFPRMKSTGLENIRTRLDYAYGDTYQLQTTEQDGWFRTKLNIAL